MCEPIEYISVIIPAYNAEKTLEFAAQSVLTQTWGNFELIIIDDGSKDNTVAVAQSIAAGDSRVRVLCNEQNRGVCYTRHRGVSEAKGKWLAFLDSDDAWHPEKLQKQVALQAKTGGKLLFTGSGFMNAEGQPKSWVLHVPEKIGYRRLLKQNLVSNSSVLVCKESFLHYEVHGERMHEDFACWLCMLRAGEFAYGIDEPLLIYRLSPASKSGNKTKAAVMNWNTYRAVGLSLPYAVYNMFFYAVNGIRKYWHLR